MADFCTFDHVTRSYGDSYWPVLPVRCRLRIYARMTGRWPLQSSVSKIPCGTSTDSTKAGSSRTTTSRRIQLSFSRSGRRGRRKSGRFDTADVHPCRHRPELLEKYPALEFLENEDTGTGVLYSSFRSEQFLDINNVPGTFYPDLVEDINQCYSIGVHDATLILTRKLLENLLIDILRKQYGKQEIELYYLPENRRFQNFSTLINNFEDNLADFQHLSGGLDGGFIDELDSFRQNANAEAHSLETNITEIKMEEYRDQVRHASQILFRVKRTYSEVP